MKKFLIIGNKNACTYKEVFVLFKNKNTVLGYTIPNQFNTPDNTITDKLQGLCRWFTNLIKKDIEPLKLTKQYNSTDYPKYDNYNAINVDKLKDMPVDYTEPIGVPITVLQYLNSDGYIEVETEQYQIIKFRKGNDGKDLSINGKPKYTRVIIKKKLKFEILGIADRKNTYGLKTKTYTIQDSQKYNNLNPNAVIKTGNQYISKYSRVIIRRI